jgi:pimeloyl-ACP methyl ester carboxylesterase
MSLQLPARKNGIGRVYLAGRALIGLFFFIAPARFDAAEIPVIAPGASQFTFHQPGGAVDRTIKVWTYRPKELAAAVPVLFVMHGEERNGERYRNEWQAYAARAQALLLVPEFSAAHFPGSRSYSAPRQASPDQSAGATVFAFAAIEQIFDQVIKTNKLTASDYRIYGHSAGAQFVHRFILSYPQARVKIAVAANAGWYLMPEFETKFPYGLKGSGLSAESLKVAFAKKLVILLGEQDADANHPQLSRTAQAKRQGANRLERGQSFFRAAQRRAETLHMPFNWELHTVPNVAHSNAGMARAAAPLLLR